MTDKKNDNSRAQTPDHKRQASIDHHTYHLNLAKKYHGMYNNDKAKKFAQTQIDKHENALKKLKEEAEQLDELSNNKLKDYIGKAKTQPLPKPGSQDGKKKTLSQARRRIQGIMNATKRLDEEVELIDELFGLGKKKPEEVAKQKSKEFAERRAKLAAKSTPNVSKPSQHWDHGGYDVTKKKGGVNREQVEVDEGVKVPTHDELEGDIKPTNLDVGKKYIKLVKKNSVGKDVKEEVEQLNELNRDTLKSYEKKANKHVDNYLDSDDFHDAATGSKKVNDEKDRRAANRIRGLIRSGKKLRKEEVEQLDELSANKLSSYTKHAAVDAAGQGRTWGIKTSFNKPEEKKEAERKITNRLRGIRRATDKLTSKAIKEHIMISFKDYLKEQFEVEYEVVETTEEVSESFISHSDFQDKLANHKKSGNVIHHDYDHRSKKAIIRHVDGEGEVREYKYHEKGTTVNRLAPMGNKTHKNDEGKSVTKHDASTHVKRGRGRPPGKYGSYKKQKKEAVAEESEQLDELSKQTLADYKKAAGGYGKSLAKPGEDSIKRAEGLKKADKRLVTAPMRSK